MTVVNTTQCSRERPDNRRQIFSIAMPRYSQIVQAPKLAVRRETGAAMIENAKLLDRLLLEKKLKPIDPDDPVPLYDVEDPNRMARLQSRTSRGLIQHLNIPIRRGELGVRALNNAHVISEPFCYLENAYASRGEIAGEAMAHNMRRDPPQVSCQHEIGVETAEVPSVAKLPLFHLGTKRLFVPLAKFQKPLKKARKRFVSGMVLSSLSFGSNVSDLRT